MGICHMCFEQVDSPILFCWNFTGVEEVIHKAVDPVLLLELCWLGKLHIVGRVQEVMGQSNRIVLSVIDVCCCHD